MPSRRPHANNMSSPRSWCALLPTARASGPVQPLEAAQESVRAWLASGQHSQALALVEGRDFVVPDDVKRLAVPVLAHRVIVKGFLQGGRRDATESLIERMVEAVATPV